MDCPNEEDLFNEIIEYDEDGDEKENMEIMLTRRNPTDKQYKMLKDFFDQENYANVGKEGLDELWAHLAARLNAIGPPEHTQSDWRRKWSIHKYKQKKMSNSVKRQSAAAQSKDITGGLISDSSTTLEDTVCFRRNVLSLMDQMSKKQDLILANQVKILNGQGSSNSCAVVQSNRYEQERFKQQKAETEGSQQRKKQNIAQMQTGWPSEMLPTAPDSSMPIIIIPRTDSSLITMFNAKDILQDMQFVTMEQKKVQGCTRDNEVLLQHITEAKCTVPYRVIDNPAKLTPHEWSCVVAVFVLGPPSQFEGWPWDCDPVKIFSKICAFHLRYDDMKLDTNIAHWSVTVLNLSRTERHLDRMVLMSFWEILDKHIAKTRSRTRTSI